MTHAEGVPEGDPFLSTVSEGWAKKLVGRSFRYRDPQDATSDEDDVTSQDASDVEGQGGEDDVVSQEAGDGESTDDEKEMKAGDKRCKDEEEEIQAQAAGDVESQSNDSTTFHAIVDLVRWWCCSGSGC